MDAAWVYYEEWVDPRKVYGNMFIGSVSERQVSSFRFRYISLIEDCVRYLTDSFRECYADIPQMARRAKHFQFYNETWQPALPLIYLCSQTSENIHIDNGRYQPREMECYSLCTVGVLLTHMYPLIHSVRRYLCSHQLYCMTGTMIIVKVDFNSSVSSLKM